MSSVDDWMNEETMTDWEYMREREHIENVRHWGEMIGLMKCLVT